MSSDDAVINLVAPASLECWRWKLPIRIWSRVSCGSVLACFPHCSVPVAPCSSQMGHWRLYEDQLPSFPISVGGHSWLYEDAKARWWSKVFSSKIVVFWCNNEVLCKQCALMVEERLNDMSFSMKTQTMCRLAMNKMTCTTKWTQTTSYLARAKTEGNLH